MRFRNNYYDTCYCDKDCESVGDCCHDYDKFCEVKQTTSKPVSVTSCEGRCSKVTSYSVLLRQGTSCHCDNFCEKIGDCCSDYKDKCQKKLVPPPPESGGSCAGKCGFQSQGCYCDSGCDRAGDCCSDYTSVCVKKPEVTTPDNVNSKTCGVRGPPGKIVGGQATVKNDYTWMALLTRGSNVQRLQIDYTQVSDLMRTHKPFCGGALVSKYWIVTASHCTTGEDGLYFETQYFN